MDFFSVKNWDELQHYKDRAPPWIKLYNHLLDDYEFACLQDASKLHLVLIWLLASRNNNRLPFNARWIKQRIGVDGDVDLNELAAMGFIEVDHSKDAALQSQEHNASTVLADCKQVATTEERRGEREERREEGEQKNVSPPALSPKVDHAIEVFNHWVLVMQKTGATKLTADRKKPIMARLKEGYSVDDLKQAINGCSVTPHNMGINDRNTKYNGLELICKNGANLERFIENAINPPDASKSAKHLQNAAAAAAIKDSILNGNEKPVAGDLGLDLNAGGLIFEQKPGSLLIEHGSNTNEQ